MLHLSYFGQALMQINIKLVFHALQLNCVDGLYFEYLYRFLCQIKKSCAYLRLSVFGIRGTIKFLL